jgi:hypothetical protein
MRVYDLVKKILEGYPETRDSDKELLWSVALHTEVLEVHRPTYELAINKSLFMKLPAFESITRARRKIQEQYPHLRASKAVQEKRNTKEETKGNFVYDEETDLFGKKS